MYSQSNQLIQTINKIFPTLLPTSRKGQNGRIGVIGGSYQFTGAPFYAAISSLKVGGDLAHIFCAKSAATAIKSYSPQIIVHPIFVSTAQIKYSTEQIQLVYHQWLQRIMIWKSAINSWIIGPGLGRDTYMNDFFPILVKNLPEGSTVIFDADGIYFLCKHPELLKQLNRFKAILTPNARQLNFLQKIIQIDIESILLKSKNTLQIQEIIDDDNKYNNFILFIKGREDIIINKNKIFIVRTIGGNKRCGGLGDILSGLIAVCAEWDQVYGPVLSSRILKIATKIAFEKQGRGLTAPKVIEQLAQVVQRIECAKL